MIICSMICFTIIALAIIGNNANDKCLHCGSKRGTLYCENCYQSLIAENMDLQLKIKELEK